MNYTELTNISPLDGRYAEKLAELRPLFSEYGLIHHRLIIEIRWLQSLSKERKIKALHKISRNENEILDQIIENFTPEEAEKVKSIEKTTNHDVKAVEYYLKEKLKDHDSFNEAQEMIHFACTSEDINNLAYGQILQKARHHVMIPMLESLTSALTGLAEQYAMLSS